MHVVDAYSRIKYRDQENGLYKTGTSNKMYGTTLAFNSLWLVM